MSACAKRVDQHEPWRDLRRSVHAVVAPRSRSVRGRRARRRVRTTSCCSHSASVCSFKTQENPFALDLDRGQPRRLDFDSGASAGCLRPTGGVQRVKPCRTRTSRRRGTITTPAISSARPAGVSPAMRDELLVLVRLLPAGDDRAVLLRRNCSSVVLSASARSPGARATACTSSSRSWPRASERRTYTLRARPQHLWVIDALERRPVAVEHLERAVGPRRDRQRDSDVANQTFDAPRCSVRRPALAVLLLVAQPGRRP